MGLRVYIGMLATFTGDHMVADNDVEWIKTPSSTVTLSVNFAISGGKMPYLLSE
jgi:hypothetical protein